MQPVLSNRWGFSLLSALISLLAIGLFAFATLIWQLPSVKILKDTHFQAPLRVFTQQGDLIAEFGEKQRLPVSLNAMPPKLVEAVLSTEDQRFYQHNGVDMISLLRAAHSLIITGEKRQGASTITMQVARNFFLSRNKTFLRKFREILLAIKLEQYLSKDEILELYLNKIFFGMRAYGVKAAARNYYGKNLHALTLAEMAMIAGLPQAPSSNNPIANPEKAIARRNHVLRKMQEQQKISQQQYQIAKTAPITAARHGARIAVHAPYVAEMARSMLMRLYGKERTYNGGLSVYTTINTNQQIAANNTVFNGLRDYDKRHGFRKTSINFIKALNLQDPQHWLAALQQQPTIQSLVPAAVVSTANNVLQAILKNGNLITIEAKDAHWALIHHRLKPRSFAQLLTPGDLIYVNNQNTAWQLDQLPKVQGALISLNTNTGFIDSLVGGFSYKLSHFNRVTQADRQPGSCFKPFIYTAALDHGSTPASIFNDAPVVIPGSGEDLLWRPENANRKFNGPTSLRQGLTHSRNLVSIRVLRTIGIDYANQYIKKFGFNNQPKSLSLALGSGSVTPLKIATAYASFANTGFKIKPILINTIIDQNGEVVFNQNLNLPKRIISAETAFLMADMLKDVISYGSGRRAKILKRNDIAGKTGTTNNKIDAWFIGFNPQLVTAVWVGFDQIAPLHEYGSQAALPIWINYMKHALLNTKQQWLTLPSNIIQVKIDPATGKRSNLANAKFEYFKQSQPPEESFAQSVEPSENIAPPLESLY